MRKEPGNASYTFKTCEESGEEDLHAHIKRLENRMKSTELIAALEIRKLKEDVENASKSVNHVFITHMFAIDICIFFCM